MSVTFNNTNLEASFIVSDVKRPLPEFRDASTVIDGANGAAFDMLTIGVRECSFDVYAVKKTQKGIQDAARVLMGVFSVTEPKALKFSDEKDSNNVQLVRYAVPTGSFDAEEFMRAGKWTLRFRSHDPHLYGASRTASLPEDTETELVMTADSGGWKAAPALVTATSTPSGTTYTLTDGTSFIRYDAEFNGNTLTLDFKKQIATLSPMIPGSDGLMFGSTFFEMSGTKKLTANATTALAWVDRWL